MTRRFVGRLLDNYAELFLGSQMLGSNFPYLEPTDRPKMQRCLAAAELEADILAAVRRLDADDRLFYLLYCRRQWTLADISEGTGWTMRHCLRRYEQLVDAIWVRLASNRMWYHHPRGRGWLARTSGMREGELPVREQP